MLLFYIQLHLKYNHSKHREQRHIANNYLGVLRALYTKRIKNIMTYLIYLNDLFETKLIFYDPSYILQLSEFVWMLRSSLFSKDVFNYFLLIDATGKSKIGRDQK